MKFFNKVEDIDQALYEECANKGKVERIDYHTTNWNGQPMDKYAFVYTPYNYDESKKYDILYLIHGGAETAEKYLYQNGEENPLKRAVDNMIDNGIIKPVIIVTPSPYPYNTVTKRDSGIPSTSFTSYFHNELCLDLIPAVEGKYHTYADFSTDAETLISVRKHRQVMGWSMGCQTTWFVFLNRIAYFSQFGFLSCQPAPIECDFTKEWADATAKVIVESVDRQGFTGKDYDAYIITGTLDQTYERVALTTAALFAYPDYFRFVGEGQNATFLMWPQGEHHTQWRLQYTINAIKQFYVK